MSTTNYKAAAENDFMQVFSELLAEMEVDESENAGYTDDLERMLEIDEEL